MRPSNTDCANSSGRTAEVVLWVVVPCYNEEAVLPQTMARLEGLVGEMAACGAVSSRSRIVYVDDCSDDGTWGLISRAHERSGLHCGLRIGVNSGQQAALMAGLEASVEEADCVVTVDADLQDDISVVPQMVGYYREGYEVVYGVRSDRSRDMVLKRWTAQAFYRLLQRLGCRTVYNHADFRLMGRRAVQELTLYGERTLFLRGIVPLMGFRSTTVSYERGVREAGTTKYSLGKMTALALHGITSLSVSPIRLISLFGLLFMLIAAGVAVWVVWCMAEGRNVPGWVSLMLSMWFIGGSILGALGLIGEYIGNISLDVKHRPRYRIEERLI